MQHMAWCSGEHRRRALEQRLTCVVDVTGRVGGGWLGRRSTGGRRARGWRSRSGSVGARWVRRHTSLVQESHVVWVRRGGGRCSRGGGDVAVLQHVARDDRLLCGPQAQVLPVVVHLDDLPQVSCGKLTALETVSGPGYCLITSMPPRVWASCSAWRRASWAP